MDWNSQGSIDNLQVFIVFRTSDISANSGKFQNAIFGNDDGKFDRFVLIYDTNSLMVGGATNSDGYICLRDFSKDADPMQTTKFCILSIHWNNKGISGCGDNKSSIYCNEKKTNSRRCIGRYIIVHNWCWRKR